MKLLLVLCILAVLSMGPLCAGQESAHRLPVAVFDFESAGEAPAKLGPKIASLLSADLRCLSPLTAVPRAKLEHQAGPPSTGNPTLEASIAPETAAQFGRQFGATALVTGRAVVTGLSAQIIAKITDADTGKIYGEMVQGPLTPQCADLASALSLKIATLLTGLRGTPVTAWAPATFHRVLGGDSVWAQPPVASIEVDGKMAAPTGDLSLSPGSHEIVASYSYDGGALRAAFQLDAAVGATYQVMFHALPHDRLQLWIANAATLAAATTTIERTWLPGSDVPLLAEARYPLPDVRFASAVVADENAIYLVGGKRMTNGSWGGGVEAVGEIVRFDLKTHQSTVLTRAIGPREYTAAVLVAGKIYILGPEDTLSSRSHSFAIYDLATQQLTYGPAMPRVVSKFGATLVSRRIYVVGGWSPEPSLIHTDVQPSTDAADYYDIDKQTWVTAARSPMAGEGQAVALAGGVVFAGGLMTKGTMNDAQGTVFVVSMKMPRMRWGLAQAANAKFARQDMTSTEATPARLDQDTPMQAVQFLDSGTGAWTFLPPLSVPTPSRSAAVLENRLFLFDDRDDSVHAYDPTSGEDLVFHLRSSRLGTSAVVAGDRLYLVGGADLREGSITVFKMNPNWRYDAPVAHPLD